MIKNTNISLFTYISGVLILITLWILFPVLAIAQEEAQVMGSRSVPDKKWQQNGVFYGYSPQQELLQYRTANSKTFQNPDGTNTILMVGPTHYKDDNGVLQDIKYTITPNNSNRNTEYKYCNTTNELKTYFPETPVKNGIRFNYAKFDFDFWRNPSMKFKVGDKLIASEKAKNTVANTLENKIFYTETYQGIKEEFEILENTKGVEHTIMLDKLPSLFPKEADATLEFTQFIPVKKGWKIFSDTIEKITNFTANSFYIEIGDEKIHFNPIIIFDNQIASKKLANEILNRLTERITEEQKVLLKNISKGSYFVEFVEGGIQLTYRIDGNWLNDKNRMFPVTIDPTVNISPDAITSSQISYLWNLFNVDTRVQSIILSSEITAAGLSNGDVITALGLYLIDNGCMQNHTGLKIRIKNTSSTSTTAFDNSGYTTNCYSGSQNLVSTGWKTHTFSSNHTFNSSYNMLIDFTMNATNFLCFAHNGFNWRYSGTNSTYRAYSISDAGDPQTWTSSSFGVYPDNEPYVPSLQITYTVSSCTAPSTQASNFTHSETATTINAGWTRGNGNNVLVVAKAGSAPTDPTNGTTYTANAAYGSGTACGGGYVVYKGSGTSVTVTGLTTGTTYYFALYEYNTTGTCYNLTQLTGTATPPTNSAPGVPSFYNTGGSEQLAFNNSYIFDDTPTFRVSATDNDGDNLEYRIEIDDNAAFSSINWTRDFTNGGSYYTSGTTYNLTCTTLSGIVAGTTYYVRVKAKDPSGTNTYGTATSSTYSFTYKSSGNVDWLQTTTTQLATGTLNGCSAASDYIAGVSASTSITTEQIVADADDGFSYSDGSTIVTGSGNDRFGYRTGAGYLNCTAGFRFQTVPIPQNAIINTASISFKCQTAEANTVNVRIKGNLVGDATAFSTSSPNTPETKTPLTTAYVDWNPGSWTSNSWYASSNISSVIQELVNQSGWASNNDMAIIVLNNGSTAYNKIIYDYYYTGNTSGAKLDINYGGNGTATSTDIEFASFYGASDWGKLQWNQTLNGGSITFKIQEYTGGSWADVTGLTSISSTGDGAKEFDISSFLSSSNTIIRIIATLTYGTSSPRLNEWKITCAFKDVTSIATTPSVAVGAGCVNSTSTASASATSVFSFRLRDMGTSDGLVTKVTQITIKKTSGTADLTNSIAGAELYLGASKITTGTAVITDDDITFPITSGNLNITNNTTSSDITMKVWLNTTNIVDNTTMVFKIDQTGHGFTTDASGSDFAADFGSAITGNTMTICITATKICFETNEPPTGVASSQVFPVSVYAGDANCNLDVDYSCNVTLTNTGSGTIQASGTPTLISQALVDGAFEWDNVYNATIGTFAIVANCGSISGTSSSITCAAAPESFSITAPLNSSGCAGNISVTWGAATGATSYSLYYCEGEDCIPTASTDYVSSVTSPRTFNASSSNTVYRFAIKAINATGATWSSNIGTYTALNGFTWKGSSNTTWTTGGNWCGGVAPTSSDDVVIPDAANTSFDPTLSSASVKSITIMSGGILNGGSGTTFNVAGNWSNSGTFTPATSTIKFNGTSDQTCDNGSSAFYHYSIDKASGILSLSENNLDVNGNLTITAGTFDAANYNINVAGNWSNSGTFDAGTGTVTFDGTTQAMNRVCTGYTTRVFSENWENGDDGWILSSVSGENEWRRQTGSAHNGSWDMAIYNLHDSQSYRFYETASTAADEYYDCKRDIDLSDYSEARLSFWYRCDGNDARRGHVLMDNTYLLDYSSLRLYDETTYTQDIRSTGSTTSNISIPSSLLGNGEHALIFRFFIGGPSSGGNTPGFCIDDIILEGNLKKDEFYNVRFNSSTSMTLNCSFSAQDIEINTGTLNTNGNRIYCTGNFTNNGTYTAASNKILFNGTSEQIIKGSSNTTFYDFEKNTNAKLIIGDPSASAKTIEVTNTFTWEDNNDEIQVGNGQVTTFKISNDNLLIQNGCTFTTASASTVSVGKSYYNYGTYNHTNSGEVTFESANNSVVLKDPAVVIYSENFESGSASGWTLENGPAANDSKWMVCSGMGNNSTYDLAIYAEDYTIMHDYNWYLNALTIYAYKTIDLSQYNTATLEFWYRAGGEVSYDYGSVIINDGIDNTVSTDLCSKQNWTQHPKIDLTPYCGKSIILKFKWQYNAKTGTSYLGSQPGLCIDDIVITGISNNMETFHNLTINKTNAANTTRLQCPIDVNNNMLINKGNFITTGFSFPVGQNWTNANSNVTFTHMNNTITFDGNQEGKSQIINSGSLVLPFYNVIVNNTGGTSNLVTLSTNKLDVDNNLTLTAGTLDANVSGAQNIDLGGNWLNNGGLYEARTNTVTFNGSSNTQQLTSRGATYNTFYNVTINNTGGSVELQDSLTMNNTMSLIKGYLNSNNKNIRLKGHWHIGNGTTYGTFNQGSGDTRVTFFGTSTQNVNLNTDNSTVNLHDFFFNDVIIDGTDVRFNLDSDTYKILVKLLQINNNKYFKVVHK